jgi:excisionase family DNA binding protein
MAWARQDCGLKAKKFLQRGITKMANSNQPTSTQAFEPLLDLQQAAKLLKLHPDTLKRKAQLREIPGVKVGRRWRFRASRLDAWVKFRLSYGTAQVTPR